MHEEKCHGSQKERKKKLLLPTHEADLLVAHSRDSATALFPLSPPRSFQSKSRNGFNDEAGAKKKKEKIIETSINTT
jgi:hypothetical protein